MKILLLYGGGIDSSTLLVQLARWYTTKNVEAIFFDYGQKAAELEAKSCQFFCDSYGVKLTIVKVPLNALTDSAIMNGSVLANDPSINVLDGRNMTFISIAAIYAAKIGADNIAVGYHIEPAARPFPDASPEFLQAINKLLPQALIHKVEVVAPFADMTRKQIFELAKRLDFRILELAHTCYEDVPGGCGQCTHCKVKEELTCVA